MRNYVISFVSYLFLFRSLSKFDCKVAIALSDELTIFCLLVSNEAEQCFYEANNFGYLFSDFADFCENSL